MAIELAAEETGAGPPVAILHGLLGSGRNWRGIAQHLAARHRVVTLDLRNHGASPWAETMSYGEMAEDVAVTLAARGHRRVALLGHSLGGKVAMIAALRQPERVARLIVVDIAPLAYRPTQTAFIRAMRALDLAAISRRSEADAALAAAVPDPAERAFLLQNLVLGDGTPHWRPNLAAIEGAMALLADFPSPAADAAYSGSALFVAGERSDYLPRSAEPAVRRWFPQAAITRIAETGHWPHAEQPARFLAAVEPFLAGDATTMAD